MNPKGLQTYKNLRPSCKVTRHLSDAGIKHYVTGQDAESVERNKEIAQCDEFGKRCKVSTFIKNNPRGRFLILTRNHALALINGTLYNNNHENAAFTNQIVSYTVKF